MDGTCDVNVVIEDSVVQRSSIAAVDEEKSREKAERKKREEEERKRREEEGRLRDLNEKSKKLAREGNSIGMKFTYIPVGEFMMGSEDGDKDEQPVHKVKINKSFYLGTYPVTQREWKAVMDSNPSEFKGDNLPVEMLSWDDAQEFVKKLNAKEGADKYRLPSESEWEYACRAGTTTRYSFGDSESKLGEYAWYADNSGRKPHPVGQKKPNPWGLYDMHGNVWEWVQDNYEFSYGVVHTDESAWEDGSSYRLFRGGGSIEYAWYCRSSSRHIGEADALYIMLGFRLLKEM
ncbi:MAG: formylglycine-generating enzyme family protein [Methanosarcinaceae archaeon]|nr:formylglycine-generating enzyme family protein [Methanosarcinaceae archaeon]